MNDSRSKDLNDNENKTNAPTIKLPVRDGGDTSILDADGKQIAFAVFAEMGAIIAALNEAEALRAEVEGLLDIVRHLADDDQCEYDHNGWCQAHHLANVNDQKYTCYNAKALAAIKPNAAAGEEGMDERKK